MRQKIYCDASYRNQTQVGSWAVIGENYQKAGIIKGKTSAGYMELYAVYQAIIESTHHTQPTTIYTDSLYVVTYLNRKAREYETLGWKRKEWTKRIPNKELLIKSYETLKKSPNIRIKKIQRENNKKADKLAKKTLKQHKEE